MTLLCYYSKPSQPCEFDHAQFSFDFLENITTIFKLYLNLLSKNKKKKKPKKQTKAKTSEIYPQIIYQLRWKHIQTTLD